METALKRKYEKRSQRYLQRLNDKSSSKTTSATTSPMQRLPIATPVEMRAMTPDHTVTGTYHTSSTPDASLSSQSNDEMDNQPSTSSSPAPPCSESPGHQTTVNPNVSTPRTQTKFDIKKSGMASSVFPPALKKKLTFANAIQQELVQAMRKSKKHRKIVSQIISGKLLKRARMQQTVRKRLGLSHHAMRVSKLRQKSVVVPKRKMMPLVRKALNDKVVEYLSRDDNSKMNPGKRDYVSVEGEKKQSRILNDYLYNIYYKFAAEYPDIKISGSLFYEMRPKHILLTSFLKNSVCLCQHHQNYALLLKSMKKVVTEAISPSPDNFLKKIVGDQQLDTLLNTIEDENVSLDQWKRTLDQRDNKVKTRIVTTEHTKEEYKALVKNATVKFRAHVARVKTQFTEIKKLKDKMTSNELLIQMDFSENYTCAQSTDEVQSSYWNKEMVTLHPCVIYWKDVNESSLHHKSIVYVSDVNHHNTSMVLAILKKMIKVDLSEMIEEKHITKITYVTDSPFSQYRNKVLFFLIANHKDVFGVTGVWNFSESGHGKGPCDGVGGSVKRQADQATKQGAKICDAQSFFQWALNTQGVIKYTYITKDDYLLCENEVNVIKPTITPLTGTRLLHAVRPGRSPNTVMWRDTSCYCDKCCEEYPSTCDWKLANLKPERNGKTRPAAESECNTCPCVCAIWKFQLVTLIKKAIPVLPLQLHLHQTLQLMIPLTMLSYLYH